MPARVRPSLPRRSLIQKRRLGPFPVDGQKRRQAQGALPAQFEPAAGLSLEEVHPPLCLGVRGMSQ